MKVYLLFWIDGGVPIFGKTHAKGLNYGNDLGFGA